MLSQSTAIGEWCLFSQYLPQTDSKHLRAVCDALTRQQPIILLLCVEQGNQCSLIFASSKGQHGLNLGALLRDLAVAHDGKGGGNVVLAQGMMARTAQSIAAFETLCRAVAQHLHTLPQA